MLRLQEPFSGRPYGASVIAREWLRAAVVAVLLVLTVTVLLGLGR